MAKVEGEYIAVNDLFGNKSGSALGLKGLRYNGVVGRRAVLNGVIKFDHWYTTLSASDFSVNSSGGNVASLASVSSYGVDVENESHDLGYDLSQETIGANNTSSSKTHSITVSQRGSGQSLRITATQAARKYSYTDYYSPSVTSVSIGTFAASGNETKYLTVYWTQSYRTYYDNGSYTNGTTSGSSTATITSGSANNSSGAYINNGGIYCPSAGKNTYTSERTVYTISAYYFYANGVGRDVRPVTIHLGQAPNSETGTKWLGTYNISISYSPTGNLSNAGGTKTISVNCTENGTITYTSTATKATTRNATATLTTTLGDLGTKSITGSGASTLTIYSNYDEKTKTATVTAKCGSTSKSVSITQAAAVYDFYFVDPGTINAYGATLNITLVSKVNGTFKEVIKDTVKLSGGTVNSITANSSEGKYSVNVTIPANSSTTSTKSYTISAQQYDTGKTTSLKITQAKKTSSYVTGSVAIKNLVSGLYVSSDGMLGGFNQYPTFTITAESNGTVNSCEYMFCLDFEIQTSNGQTFNARYEHQMDYIDIQAFSGTKKVQFINFPQSFSLQELTNYGFDPYYSSIMSIRVIADIERVSGSGLLMLGGSISDYTWYV